MDGKKRWSNVRRAIQDADSKQLEYVCSQNGNNVLHVLVQKIGSQDADEKPSKMASECLRLVLEANYNLATQRNKRYEFPLSYVFFSGVFTDDDFDRLLAATKGVSASKIYQLLTESTGIMEDIAS